MSQCMLYSTKSTPETRTLVDVDTWSCPMGVWKRTSYYYKKPIPQQTVSEKSQYTQGVYEGERSNIHVLCAIIRQFETIPGLEVMYKFVKACD